MTNKDKLKLFQQIAVIAGIFSIAVAILLLLNYAQLSKSDPVESKTLLALVDRLKQDPNNKDLKMEIRQFDLLARKAYFNSQWQVKTGAYILLFGAVVLAFVLRAYYALRARIDEPGMERENEITSRILAQKGIIIAGVALLILAFGASWLSVDHLKSYQVENEISPAETTPAGTGIEVIEVGAVPGSKESAGPAQQALEPSQPGAVESSGAGQMVTANTTGAQTTTATPPDASPSAPATGPAGLDANSIKKNHNSFRGPFSRGIVYHKNIPVAWDGSSGTNILWKSPVPKRGYNSPVIWGDRIFIAGADSQGREVYCYSLSDGKLLWTAKADNIPGSPAAPPKVTEDTGLSAPTMTTDGRNVYAIFATGDVMAVSLDGKRIWAINLGVPDNHYGHSSSLIAWSGKVFVQYDTNRGGKIIALDAASGNKVWETARKAKISWASPVLAEADGKYQLVLTADPIVAGYDPGTGKELWSVECMMGEVGPSVAFGDGIVVAANEYAKMVAIDIKTSEILWENDEYLPEASSPVAWNGLLFIATSYGVLACYDLKTGDKYWEHDVGTTLYSSPVIADGKLFMMDNDGMMRVYQAGKEMKLISENELGEVAGTTPAFSENRIVIRGEKHLFCIGK